MDAVIANGTQLHLAYTHTRSGINRLGYRVWSGSSWSDETTLADIQPLLEHNISIDDYSDGTTGIAHYDIGVGGVQYTQVLGGGVGVIRETVASAGGGTGAFPCAAIDRFDEPHVVFYDDSVSPAQLSYASPPASAEPIFDAPLQTSCAATNNGTPCVAIVDYATQEVWYGCRDSTGDWPLEAVTGDGFYALTPALVHDHRNAPHIVFYDYLTGALWYARRSGLGIVWELGMIDDDGDVGYMPDIAVDADRQLHVTYQDRGRSQLKYAVGR